MNVKKERKFFVVLSVLWVMGVLAGMVHLIHYRDTPGASAPKSDWPVASSIKPDTEHDTLILLAHPHCPCTKASLAELMRLMSQAGGNLTTYVVFIKPEGFPIDWEKTDLWAAAAAIPGVHVVLDQNGVEAERFQAATSGQSMLFDKNGKLLFTGGITGARGHEGDNEGREAILAFLNSGHSDENGTPVYGCALFSPEKEAASSAENNANITR